MSKRTELRRPGFRPFFLGGGGGLKGLIGHESGGFKFAFKNMISEIVLIDFEGPVLSFSILSFPFFHPFYSNFK